jgi:serine/threonine-protein kinase RsbT
MDVFSRLWTSNAADSLEKETGETGLLATNAPLFQPGETTVTIASDGDIVAARQQCRALVLRLGFAPTDATLVATAVSELARNIVLYAKRGDISLTPLENRGRRGVLVVARDDGPGIPDIQRATGGGGSTSGSLGLGLRGVKRLMDEFEIVSAAGRGTTVRVKKFSGPVGSLNAICPPSAF